MTSGSLPSNPFVAAGMIEDSKLFVGRKDELRAIASRMSGVTIVAIVFCSQLAVVPVVT